MPRANLILSDQLPYHVMIRTTGKFFFDIPTSEVFKIIEIWLNMTSIYYDVQIHHFVLMSNHLHILLSTPQKNLPFATSYLFTNISKEINARADSSGHLWGSRHKRSLIFTQDAYLKTLKYLYRNPCRQNMTKLVELYPYSTIQYYYGNSPIHIFLKPDPMDLEIDYDFEFLDWLNNPFSSEENEQIKKSLMRSKLKK